MPGESMTGVVLAGGLGRRMGGLDKGLQQLDGRPLVAHVLARLRPQVGQIMINANRHQSEYAAYGHPVISDVFPDFSGPLAGLHVALGSARTPLVLTVPCDVPNLPCDLAARLLTALSASSAPLAMARAAGRLHPVFCLCRQELLPDLSAYLAGGGRRVADWCADAGACVVDFDDQAAAFRNFNTLEDLSANS